MVHDCLAHVDPLAVMRAATAQRQQRQQQEQQEQQQQQQQQQQPSSQALGNGESRSAAVAFLGSAAGTRAKGTRSAGAMMRMQGATSPAFTVVRAEPMSLRAVVSTCMLGEAEEPMSLRARASARVQQQLRERRRDDPELECALSTQLEGTAGGAGAAAGGAAASGAAAASAGASAAAGAAAAAVAAAAGAAAAAVAGAAGACDRASMAAALRTAGRVLESGLVERGTEARLLLLALVGSEHLLLLGPPGTLMTIDDH